VGTNAQTASSPDDKKTLTLKKHLQKYHNDLLKMNMKYYPFST
jgi:hypothetical protein